MTLQQPEPRLPLRARSRQALLRVAAGLVWTLAAGCGAAIPPLGRGPHVVECRGSKDECQRAAARYCVHGFEVIRTTEQRGAQPWAASQVTPGEVTYRASLRVQCRTATRLDLVPAAPTGLRLVALGWRW